MYHNNKDDPRKKIVAHAISIGVSCSKIPLSQFGYEIDFIMVVHSHLNSYDV